ncbi:DUF4190 domain-containing protein [Agromyces indicus]|uniref:DUF4190 domain-containing protein n=1 Tax=Agromyces indicus TaxID=758919 RepID=A0ABU1FL83_9MICO|nr:DUF4190 domain-containing protein [Agromyces indicus]MDR5692514.1 DUF4190 domain-containing protein [Agromyces indicus]
MSDERMPRGDERAAPGGSPSPPEPDALRGIDTSPPEPQREFDVPYDTGELHGLPTGQLLALGRPAPEPEYVDEEEQRRFWSRLSAGLGIPGAVASLFVGWMLPLSIAAIVFGVMGLRREEGARVPAFIGIGTGIAGLVFSGVWIGYYAIVFGALPR